MGLDEVIREDGPRIERHLPSWNWSGAVFATTEQRSKRRAPGSCFLESHEIDPEILDSMVRG